MPKSLSPSGPELLHIETFAFDEPAGGSSIGEAAKLSVALAS